MKFRHCGILVKFALRRAQFEFAEGNLGDGGGGLEYLGGGGLGIETVAMLLTGGETKLDLDGIGSIVHNRGNRDNNNSTGSSGLFCCSTGR